MVGKYLSEVKEIYFDSLGDDRGQLVALEQHKSIPFDIKRVYYMIHTLADVKRGLHAHKQLEQVAICLTGSCTINVESLAGKQGFTLADPHDGLYMGGLVWRELSDFSEDCVVVVIASELYSEDDYIRDYNEFLKYAKT